MRYGKNKARLEKETQAEADFLRSRLGLGSDQMVTNGPTTLFGQRVRITSVVAPSNVPGTYAALVVRKQLRQGPLRLKITA